MKSASSTSPSSYLGSFCRRFWLLPIVISYLLIEVFFLSPISNSTSSASSSSSNTAKRIKQQMNRKTAANEEYRPCPCYEPEDECPYPVSSTELFTSPSSLLPSTLVSSYQKPVQGVYRTPGKGLDRCKVQKYAEPYLGRDKVRNSSWPFISEDSYRELSDWIIDSPEYDCKFSPDEVQCGDIIFCKTDFVDDFFVYHHPKITQPYLLITHASDLAVPSFLVRNILRKNRGNLIRWYAAQLANDHPEHIMSYTPLGMNSPGWYPEPGSGMKGHYTFPWEIAQTLRSKIIKYLNNSYDKDELALVAFTVQNNEPERSAALDGAKKLGFAMQRVKPDAWAELLHRRLFIWTPLGNPVGVESHRMWEALIGGALPVVRLGEYESLLSCLPFIPIVKWEDITWDEVNYYVKEVLYKLDNNYYDFSRIFLNYQVARFQRAKKRIQSNMCNKK